MCDTRIATEADTHAQCCYCDEHFVAGQPIAEDVDGESDGEGWHGRVRRWHAPCLVVERDELAALRSGVAQAWAARRSA